MTINTYKPDEKDSSFNMLVYGAPGTGKTYLAKTACDSGRKVLLVNIESGIMSIRNSDCDIVDASSIEEVRSIYKYLKNGDHEYDTVFIDSLTELQKKVVDNIKQSRGNMRIQDWGEVIDQTRSITRSFRDLQMNTVILCLSSELKDEDGDNSGTRIRPDLYGQNLPNEIGGFFDIVAYSHKAKNENGEIEYRLGFTTPGDRHITKDRSGKLSQSEISDFALIYEKVNQSSQNISEKSNHLDILHKEAA